MTPTQITYLVFGVVLVLAVIFDLGLLSKRSSTISIKKAFWQTLFWVLLAFGFFFFMWFEKGQTEAFEYISAYLMEWSLSIDNIFVFILILTFFNIREDHYARALLIGILLAILFRIIFISVGVVLVEKFEWILYIFGAFLVYTGIKIFTVKQEEEFDPADNIVYKWLKKILPIEPSDVSGRFIINKDGKRFYTSMFVVIVLLATTDIVFALDSIPAVFAISQDRLVIYTSNIFAVLGLRSLFFLLKGVLKKFSYLQQGIGIVLIFIGLKMLVEIFHIKIPAYISLMVIVICIAGSIIYSLQVENQNEKQS
ncbi:MAG TPA: TerC/Alx family metal homeostasis membrane protein [Chitinophagaceae bacterium]|jgi:tellurite resistance protein TerC|nr:TerC/Alx family metal homeostasis membrane protein [Chitinophagaceae bacterium]